MLARPAGTLPEFKRGNNSVTAASMNTLVKYAEGPYREPGAATRGPSAGTPNVLRRAMLLDYIDEAGGDGPIGVAFKGRLVSADGEVWPPAPDFLKFHTFKYPAEDDLRDCLPSMAAGFNSTNPRHWVPVALFYCDINATGTPPPPPPPDPHTDPPGGSGGTGTPTPPPIDPFDSENEPTLDPPIIPPGPRGGTPPPGSEPSYQACWFVMLTFTGTCPEAPPP